ncbi:MAG TPA: hypothetical protein ENJ23_00635 [Bacteroidetes bacterium]|nr:hypothetical protein [Bacteroidota bacterium]
MSERAEEHRDQHPVGAVKEFVSYYHQEMHRNIDRLRELGSRIGKADSDEIAEEVRKVGQAIYDLAMVYGFETVEVIGQGIIRFVGEWDKGQDAESIRAGLEKFALAAEESMFLKDSVPEVGLPVESEQAASEDDWKPEEENEAPAAREEQGETFLFDIKEDERLISMLRDAEGEALVMDEDVGGIDVGEEMEVLDVNSILPEEKKRHEFDIPPDNEEESMDLLEQDILEIDFTQPEEEKDEEKKSLLKKISSIFSKKSGNRISFQE